MGNLRAISSSHRLFRARYCRLRNICCHGNGIIIGSPGLKEDLTRKIFDYAMNREKRIEGTQKCFLCSSMAAVLLRVKAIFYQ